MDIMEFMDSMQTEIPMCRAEEITPDALDLKGSIRFDGLIRRKDGRYGFRFFVDYTADPQDGRKVRVNSYFTVPATQCIGRKRPEPVAKTA